MTASHHCLHERAWTGPVRVRPHALSLDPDGPRFKDAAWLWVPDGNGGVRLHNTATGHFTDLRPEDVVHVAMDTRNSAPGAVVTLRRRLVLQGPRLGWVRS